MGGGFSKYLEKKKKRIQLKKKKKKKKQSMSADIGNTTTHLYK